jgi:hypothetical protein
MIWARNVARVGPIYIYPNNILDGKYLKGADHIEYLGVDLRIILKWILKK